MSVAERRNTRLLNALRPKKRKKIRRYKMKTLTVINSLAGNLIVKVKESRIALNKDLAKKIMV